ncbi:hypothetical protein GOBAR_DD19868 [Gossypium barbadense]|nr:hypothetical protein GOBAR_DD19868 [Gossypium barbadense]
MLTGKLKLLRIDAEKFAGGHLSERVAGDMNYWWRVWVYGVRGLEVEIKTTVSGLRERGEKQEAWDSEV